VAKTKGLGFGNQSAMMYAAIANHGDPSVLRHYSRVGWPPAERRRQHRSSSRVT
jgi:hypothetical protein